MSNPHANHQGEPGDTGTGWVLVPRTATRDWAHAMATQRQGRSNEPRCEPVGERDIAWARERIAEALASAPSPDPAGAGGDLGEQKGEPASPSGSREPGPAVPASGFDPSRGWRPIWEAPKGRDENGILQQVLLIGSYPSNGHHTDIVQSWWCPVGSADVDGYWERWRHAFSPSHWMPVPAPPSVRDRRSEAAETSGSAEGKSPADLSATPEATPKPSPDQTPVDPQELSFGPGCYDFASSVASKVAALPWAWAETGDAQDDRYSDVQTIVDAELRSLANDRTLQAGGEVRPLQVREGAYYASAAGERIGPMFRIKGDAAQVWYAKGQRGDWASDGQALHSFPRDNLVAEWPSTEEAAR